MVAAAAKVVFIYWAIMTVDYLTAWQTFTRPIVVAPLTGLILGDLKTGILMGASLESIFMGISAIGGVVPADATMSSLISVAFTILTGASAEEGLAIAMPIGTVASSLGTLTTPVFASLAPYWEKLATESSDKKFMTISLLFHIFVTQLVSFVVVFVAIAYGVEGLATLLDKLPAWVSSGLAASSRMLLGIGFAITTSMIWSKETGIYFFVGYVLASYAGLGTLPIAILGLALAFTIFMNDKKSIELKKELSDASVSGGLTNNEEDFF